MSYFVEPSKRRKNVVTSTPVRGINVSFSTTSLDSSTSIVNHDNDENRMFYDQCDAPLDLRMTRKAVDKIHLEDEMVSDLQDEVTIGTDSALLNDFSIFEYFEPYRIDSFDNADDDQVEQISDSEEIDMSGHCLDDIEKEEVVNKVPAVSLRIMNKDRKEKGMEYTRKDGTVVPARRLRPACNCRMKCNEKYNDDTRQLLLQNLLRLKLSGQNQFLACHMSVTETKRYKVCDKLCILGKILSYNNFYRRSSTLDVDSVACISCQL